LRSNWKDKLVWVTGASSGLGEAFAREFANQGAKVVLSSRSEEKLNAILQTLPGENHKIIPVDVSNQDSIQRAIQENAEIVSATDVLINNAGISQRALMTETSLETERRIMETNYFGATALTKAVLPGMINRKNGSIIVMSSPAGAFGFPLRSSYSASKHALHGYFDTLRAELKGSGITITLALPGRVKTNMSINAMMGDGSNQGTMDERLNHGLEPDICAKRIMNAASKGKAELYLGREQALIYIKRYLPSLFRKIVTKFNPN